jgi:hypothetical protein
MSNKDEADRQTTRLQDKHADGSQHRHTTSRKIRAGQKSAERERHKAVLHLRGGGVRGGPTRPSARISQHKRRLSQHVFSSYRAHIHQRLQLAAQGAQLKQHCKDRARQKQKMTGSLAWSRLGDTTPRERCSPAASRVRAAPRSFWRAKRSRVSRTEQQQQSGKTSERQSRKRQSISDLSQRQQTARTKRDR